MTVRRERRFKTIEGNFEAVIIGYREVVKEAESAKLLAIAEKNGYTTSALNVELDFLVDTGSGEFTRKITARGYAIIGWEDQGNLGVYNLDWVNGIRGVLNACDINKTSLEDEEGDFAYSGWDFDPSDIEGRHVTLDLEQNGEYTNVTRNSVQPSNIQSVDTVWDGWEAYQEANAVEDEF